MQVKRNKLNEYIIKQVLTGETKGYNSKLNGEFVWSVKFDEFYDKFVLRTPCMMGYSITFVDETNIDKALDKIDEAYNKVFDIAVMNKGIEEFLTQPENKKWLND